jgi:Zn-finger nucleic acid-binding protein
MRCPLCANVLTTLTTGGITVDACERGCGGTWFDGYELMRVDETHESAGKGLLEIRRDPDLEVDLSKRLSCPKCPRVVMARHVFSTKRKVVIDECPNCGGYWLAPGELGTIRTEYVSEEERKRPAEAYFSEIFSPELAAAHAETEGDLARARKVAHAFRFICPSYYIPGKQDWGAF